MMILDSNLRFLGHPVYVNMKLVPYPFTLAAVKSFFHFKNL